MASGGPRILFRLADENDLGVGRNLASSSHQHQRGTLALLHQELLHQESRVYSSLVIICDIRWKSSRRLEGLDDLYEDQEPDHVDWLHVPDSNATISKQAIRITMERHCQRRLLGGSP